MLGRRKRGREEGRKREQEKQRETMNWKQIFILILAQSLDKIRAFANEHHADYRYFVSSVEGSGIALCSVTSNMTPFEEASILTVMILCLWHTI